VKELTYKISKYPSTQQLSAQGVDAEIQRALNIWSAVTDLTFDQRQSGRVHIEIRFESHKHGDGDPCDGKGGTLAHAFFPVYGGDAHFDDSETWTINSYKGTNLLQTAAHEFGHSLGLSHSDQHRAMMAPFYRGYNAQLALDADDITAIQLLYGKKSPEMLKPTSPISFPTESGQPDAIPGPEEEEVIYEDLLRTRNGIRLARLGRE
jgi:matrix metalloproteinase-14 (membrane-inserted)